MRERPAARREQVEKGATVRERGREQISTRMLLRGWEGLNLVQGRGGDSREEDEVETGTATVTIMILGDTCTRGCRFCAVKTSRAPPPPDPKEPENVSEAIVAWGLDYVVLTSVDTDDLPDQGSNHFAETVRLLKARKPTMLVEALVPDFRRDSECVERVASSGLDVFAHNIETVEELQSAVRDHRANFKQSVDVLKMAKSIAPAGTLTKTSVMLGCGETPSQVIKTMEKVREAGVDVIVWAVHAPNQKAYACVRVFTPEAFDKYREYGEQLTEKNELLDEKLRLKADKERLEQQLKAITIPLGYLTHPAALHAAAATFATQAQATSKAPHLAGYPGIAMWQWMPSATVDTSQDHVLKPPVA